MSQKLNFARQLQLDAGNLAQLKDTILTRTGIYFDRGYNSTDAITDEDVASLGILAVDVSNWITLLQQLENFFGNVAVAQGDYDATTNKIRNDI